MGHYLRRGAFLNENVLSGQKQLFSVENDVITSKIAAYASNDCS
jgi:hypothetical protein